MGMGKAPAPQRGSRRFSHAGYIFRHWRRGAVEREARRSKADTAISDVN